MYKYKTVMIIDDSEMDNILNKMILQTMQYAEKIITHSNPLQAIQFFKGIENNDSNEIPEIVFLDINMPIMSGFDFLEEFKKFPAELRSKVKFYVLSSSEDPEDLEKIKGYQNVIKYLYKPLNKAEIL